MKGQELREVLGLLEQAGWSPRVCDTMVHLSACPVRCGMPALPGDDSRGEGVMLPESLVGCQPELFVPARGDSMVDAGFDEGDLLRVRLNMLVHDGDIVVAMVDGQTTVKVMFTDERGQRWLVPRNERYDAILLPEDSDVRLLGTVVGIEKRVLRASSADCLKSIRRTVAKHQKPPQLTPAEVDVVIAAMGDEVQNGRQWYAVYRPLVDRGLMDEGCFRGFCERVARVIPGHAHLPVAKELGN